MLEKGKKVAKGGGLIIGIISVLCVPALSYLESREARLGAEAAVRGAAKAGKDNIKSDRSVDIALTEIAEELDKLWKVKEDGYATMTALASRVDFLEKAMIAQMGRRGRRIIDEAPTMPVFSPPEQKVSRVPRSLKLAQEMALD